MSKQEAKSTKEQPIEQASQAIAGHRISGREFADLWVSEVPKVVERHRQEVLDVRKALGLAG